MLSKTNYVAEGVAGINRLDAKDRFVKHDIPNWVMMKISEFPSVGKNTRLIHIKTVVSCDNIATPVDLVTKEILPWASFTIGN